MTVAIVRSSIKLQAVHASDEDFDDVLRGWFEEGQIPKERGEEFLGQLKQQLDSAFKNAKPWLVNHHEGLAIVPAADFAAEYEDVNATNFLDEVWLARTGQLVKYPSEHDDAHGLSHLLREAVSHLQGFGETPTDEHIAGEIVIAGGLLNAAHDLITRGQSKSKEPLPAFYDEGAMKRYEAQWIDRVSEFSQVLEETDGDEATIARLKGAFQSIFKVSDKR